MDKEEISLSLRLLQENTQIIQADVSKVQSDVRTLKIDSVKVNVTNQVTANSNNPVSSKAVYEYVNQNLNSGASLPTGGTTGQVLTVNDQGTAAWETPDGALPAGGTTGQVLTVNDQGFSWQTPGIYLPEGGTTGQVLKVNEQGDATWQTPGTYLPEGGITGQVLTVNDQGVFIWDASPEGTGIPSVPGSDIFQFDAKVDQGNITVTDFTGTPVPYWTSFGPNYVNLDGGAAFVTPNDGTYNVNLSLAIINSSLALNDKYILNIQKINPSGWAAATDLIKPAVQTYNFTTAVYDDTATVSGTTVIPLGGQTNANLVVSNGGTIPDNSGVALNGMLGNPTSYISLNDNDYFNGINGLNEFSIEINFKPATNGNLKIFKMSSSDRTEVLLEAMQPYPDRNFRLNWRTNTTDTEADSYGGYVYINFSEGGQIFNHLILVFKSSEVVSYINGTLYEPHPLFQQQNSFMLKNITSIELGGASTTEADSGNERFRSFRFYDSEVSVPDASLLYAQRQWETSIINTNEFISDGNTSFLINHDVSFDLTTGDELLVSLGGWSVDAGRDYTLSSGANSGEPESTITVARNTDNQNVADSYVLAVNNSRQVVWEEAPKSNEYFFATSHASKTDFSSGLKILDHWTLELASSSSMFSDGYYVFTAPRAGVYRVRFDVEILHDWVYNPANSELKFGITYPVSETGQPQLYTVPNFTPLVAYDFRTMTATESSSNGDGVTIYNLTPPTVSNPQVQQSNSALLKGYSASDLQTSMPNSISGITGTAQTWVELDPQDFIIPSDGFTIEWYGIIGNSADGTGLFDMYDPDPTNQIPTPTAPAPGARNRFGLWNGGAFYHDNLMLYFENGVESGGQKRLHLYNVVKTDLIHLVIVFSPSARPETYVNGAEASYGIVEQSINYPTPGWSPTYVTLGRRPDVDGGGEQTRSFRLFPGIFTADMAKTLYDNTTIGFTESYTQGTGDAQAVTSGSQFLSIEKMVSLEANDKLAFAQKTDTGNHGTKANVLIHSVD